MKTGRLLELWNRSDIFKRIFLFLFFGRSKRIDFYESMVNYLSVGSSLTKCFDKLIIDSTQTKQKQLLIYEVVKSNIEKGMELNEALTYRIKSANRKRGYLSELFIKLGFFKEEAGTGDLVIKFIPSNELAMIKSGEQSDALIKSINNIKNNLEVLTELQQHFIVRVGLTVAVAIAAFFSIVYQVGAYSKIREYFLKEDTEFPPLVENFFMFGDVLKNHTLLIGVIIAAFFLIIAYSLPNYIGRYRSWIQNKLPPWNVYRNFKASEFFLSFSSLMNSGMKTSDSLGMMIPYANRYVKSYVSMMRQKVIRGKDDRISFDSDLFPLRTRLVLFAILETEAKSLAESVEVLADRQTKQAKKSVNKLAAIFGSALFFTIVAFVVWSMAVQFELQDIIAADFGD